MPEEQIISNQTKQTAEHLPDTKTETQFAESPESIAPQESIALQEKKPTPKIQKPELGQGGLGGLSHAKQLQIKHTKEVESVMEKNIENIYVKMSNDLQQKFKIKGETTANKINKILNKTKINIKKIIKLIKKL